MGRCVRIWKDSRRFVPTGVFVITGVSECAVNIRRRPDDVAVLLVSPRRREANFQLKSTFSEKRSVCTCMRRIVAHVRALSEKKHLSSFFGRELFLAFVSIFYVNSFYIEFVPSRSFSASHRKKNTSFLWHCHRL